MQLELGKLKSKQAWGIEELEEQEKRCGLCLIG